MKLIREKFIENKYTANKPTKIIYEVVQKNGCKFPATESYSKALELAFHYDAPIIIERRVIKISK